MKKIFVSLLYLLFLSSIYGNVYASGIGVRDIFVGTFSRIFSSDKKDGNTNDQYVNKLGESIKVISSIKAEDFKEEQNKAELENIRIEEVKELHSRVRKSFVKRTCDDIHDNLRDCPAGCSSCCCGCWDCLKGFYKCFCCSECCSGRRGCCNNYESLSLDDNYEKNK